jgi:hypothetical protein
MPYARSLARMLPYCVRLRLPLRDACVTRNRPSRGPLLPCVSHCTRCAHILFIRLICSRAHFSPLTRVQHDLLDATAHAALRKSLAHFAKAARTAPASRLALQKVLRFYAATE